MFEEQFTFDKVVRIAIAVGLLWGTVAVMGYLSDVLIPFFAALLIAYLLNPLVNRLESLLKNRVIAVLAAIVLLAVASGLIFWIVVPTLLSELQHMGKLVSGFVGDSGIARKAAERLPPDIFESIKKIFGRPEIQEFFKSDGVSSTLLSAGKKVLPGVWSVVNNAADLVFGLLGIFVVLLYVVFLLLDFKNVQTNWDKYLPEKLRGPVAEVADEFQLAMGRYFRAQALVAFIVGVLFSIGFSIVGLPLAIMLGMFIGLLNMVPYLQLLGIPVAALLALIQALETGDPFLTVFGLTALVFAVVQIIQDGYLVPKIMGKAMGLSPAIILLSLSVWGKLLGLLGLLIALPMTCLCLAWYRRLILNSENKETEENLLE
jgi:predicted PurR-regulated permease PerM